MTLVDTSAWVEYLRASGSDVHRRVRQMIETEASMHTTDTVVMEVLAGGRDDAHTAQLRGLLLRCDFIPLEGLGDHEAAASLYRTCRSAGETIRAVNDCLVAAVAIRADVELLHSDRDFAAIARHSGLRLAAHP